MKPIKEGALGAQARETMKLGTQEQSGVVAPLSAGNRLITGGLESSVFQPPPPFGREQHGRRPNFRRPSLTLLGRPPVLGGLADGVVLRRGGPTMDLGNASRARRGVTPETGVGRPAGVLEASAGH